MICRICGRGSCTESFHSTEEQVTADAAALTVACPKCGARPGRECNPHTDKDTGKPIYREPHRRRVEAGQTGSVDK